MNYCEKNPKTCSNGGKCTSITEDEGSYKCECPTGFKGKSCEIVPMIGNSTISTIRPKPTTTTVKPTTPPTETTTMTTELESDLADDLEASDQGDEKPTVDDELNNEA